MSSEGEMMKTIMFVFVGMISAASGFAETGGQFFFRGGIGFLKNNRGGQIFTDTNSAAGLKNDETSGFSIGAGLDVALVRNFGPGSLLGEIAMDYAEYSRKSVVQTSPSLLGATTLSSIPVSLLSVTIGPKYRLDEIMGGKLRPWIMPAALSFLINSPPTNDATSNDIGYSAGIGAEYLICSAISLGVSGRYTLSMERSHLDNSNYAVDGYLGFNF
jgi:opacity protein-like surface antigen